MPLSKNLEAEVSEYFFDGSVSRTSGKPWCIYVRVRGEVHDLGTPHIIANLPLALARKKFSWVSCLIISSSLNLETNTCRSDSNHLSDTNFMQDSRSTRCRDSGTWWEMRVHMLLLHWPVGSMWERESATLRTSTNYRHTRSCGGSLTFPCASENVNICYLGHLWDYWEGFLCNTQGIVVPSPAFSGKR